MNKKGQMGSSIDAIGAMIVPIIVILVVSTVGYLILAEGIPDGEIVSFPAEIAMGAIKNF